MTPARYETEAQAAGLTIRGAFHPGSADQAPHGCGTLLLFGPDEPQFWDVYSSAPEAQDGAAHPLDRWSKRVIGAMAAAWGGSAIFPYDGPPYAPFLRWAEASGRCWPSPTGLLVHDHAGLLISFRGAIALPQRLDLAPPAINPCDRCKARPCQAACPVGALRPDAAYDVPACQAHLRAPEGRECRKGGCLVRRVCPVSARMTRAPEQAAFHMAAFVKD